MIFLVPCLLIKSLYVKDENSMFTYRLCYFTEQWCKNSISSGKTSSIDVKKKKLIALNVTNISAEPWNLIYKIWSTKNVISTTRIGKIQELQKKNHVFHNTFAKSIDIFFLSVVQFWKKFWFQSQKLFDINLVSFDCSFGNELAFFIELCA